jgi:tryptophan synthase alpha chain
MTYYNPVLQYGLSRFANDAVAAGVDGFIITDLPPEEAAPWLTESDAAGLATIFLLAPTSNKGRIDAVAAKMRRGFVYCVSRTGVTGAQRDVPADLAELIAGIRAATPLPVCVGFGVSTPEHVATIAKVADGAVIGSLLVDFLHRNAGKIELLAELSTMSASWKAATRR